MTLALNAENVAGAANRPNQKRKERTINMSVTKSASTRSTRRPSTHAHKARKYQVRVKKNGKHVLSTHPASKKETKVAADALTDMFGTDNPELSMTAHSIEDPTPEQLAATPGYEDGGNDPWAGINIDALSSDEDDDDAGEVGEGDESKSCAA